MSVVRGDMILCLPRRGHGAACLGREHADVPSRSRRRDMYFPRVEKDVCFLQEGAWGMSAAEGCVGIC